MDDRTHGGAGYAGRAPSPRQARVLRRPWRSPTRARPLGLGLLLGLALLAPPVVAAPKGPVRLRADDRPLALEIKRPGEALTYEIIALSGCRYRLEVRGETLRRSVLEVGRQGEEPFVRVTAGDDLVARHIWQAVRDERLLVRVSGLSAFTGSAHLRFATLGPGDKPTVPHRRVLVPDEEAARVGELMLGESNTWDLAVEPGVAYQITPTEGSAGRVRLRVLGADDAVLGDSEQGALAMRPLPPVRFLVPDPLPAATDAGAPLRLDVRGTFDGGGSYGLKLRRLDEDETIDPPAVDLPEPEPSAILAEGPVPVVRARPGDLVLVNIPQAAENPYIVQRKRGTRWVSADGLGQEQRARTHYDAGMTWFRPYHAGTYRFIGIRGPAPSADVQLLDRAELGGAPIHMGTGVDPEVKAKLARDWKLVALGACMPGWDYLFVLRGAPQSGISMRVVGPDGSVVGTRGAYGAGTFSPGLGPTLRFEAKKPGIYRLEARDKKGRLVVAMLRHAEERR